MCLVDQFLIGRSITNEIKTVMKKVSSELTNTQMVEYLCKEDENKKSVFSLDDSPEKLDKFPNNSFDSLFLRESQPVNFEETKDFPKLNHTQKEDDTNWWKLPNNKKSEEIKEEKNKTTEHKPKQKTLDEFRTPKRKREDTPPKKLERISISSEEPSPNNEVSPSIIVPETPIFIKPPEISQMLEPTQKHTQWSHPQWKDEFGDSIDFNYSQKLNQEQNVFVDQYLNVDMLKGQTPSPKVRNLNQKEVEIPSNISSPLYEKTDIEPSREKDFGNEETQLPLGYRKPEEDEEEEKSFLEPSQIPENKEEQTIQEKVEEKPKERKEEKVEPKKVEEKKEKKKKSKETTKKKKELKDGDITKYMTKKKPESKSPKKKKRKLEDEEDSLESFEKCALCLSVSDDYPEEIKEQLKEMIGPIEHKEYGYKLYLHENCAIYTPEVFQEKNGEFKNLKKAIDRGRRTICSLCKKRGATIGCKNEDCKKVYHYPCGLKVNGKFEENFEFSCPKHKE